MHGTTESTPEQEQHSTNLYSFDPGLSSIEASLLAMAIPRRVRQQSQAGGGTTTHLNTWPMVHGRAGVRSHIVDYLVVAAPLSLLPRA